MQNHELIHTPPHARADMPEDQEHEVSLGTEVHGAVFLIAGLAYGWVLLVAWFAFGQNNAVHLDLSIVTVIFAVFMGVAGLAYGVAHTHLHKKLPSWDEFVWSKISVATGAISGWEAGLQIMIIPMALAVAATIFGIIYAFTSM